MQHLIATYGPPSAPKLPTALLRGIRRSRRATRPTVGIVGPEPIPVTMDNGGASGATSYHGELDHRHFRRGRVNMP